MFWVVDNDFEHLVNSSGRRTASKTSRPSTPGPQSLQHSSATNFTFLNGYSGSQHKQPITPMPIYSRPLSASPSTNSIPIMPAQNVIASNGISMLSSATQFVNHDNNNRPVHEIANIEYCENNKI
jgi:hypothetical protein